MKNPFGVQAIELMGELVESWGLRADGPPEPVIALELKGEERFLPTAGGA